MMGHFPLPLLDRHKCHLKTTPRPAGAMNFPLLLLPAIISGGHRAPLDFLHIPLDIIIIIII